jgi:site-specific DNA-methyltransferase (adenine-specific)
MASFNGKFVSAKQDWETPVELFDEINKEFNFTLDAAASSANKKVNNFFSKDDDGLSQPWINEVVWLNPPYGDNGYKISDWVKKAADERFNGSTTVMLIPARTNTNWFHDICLKYGEVRFLKGRPKFGGATHGLPQPLCFVIFRAARKALEGKDD